MGGQLGGLFSRELTFWLLARRSVRNAVPKMAGDRGKWKRTATGHLSPRVVGEGPPKLRHDSERRRYQRRRLPDTLQRFGRRPSQTEKRHCRYPPKSRWQPIPARHNTPAHADRGERRLPTPMEASRQDQDFDASPQRGHRVIRGYSPTLIWLRPPKALLRLVTSRIAVSSSRLA